jgi:Mce-associated membrane protein
MALILTRGVGYLKWRNGSEQESRVAAVESVRAVTDGTIAMLSYRPDTAEKELAAARNRLTGSLLDS